MISHIVLTVLIFSHTGCCFLLQGMSQANRMVYHSEQTPTAKSKSSSSDSGVQTGSSYHGDKQNLSTQSSSNEKTFEKWMKNWPGIATVSGKDWLAMIHIRSLLESHGIPDFMDGSVLYGVNVPTKYRIQAIRYLKQDVIRHPYKIWLADEVKGTGHFYGVPDSAWITKKINKTYKSLLHEAEFSYGTDMGRILRQPLLRHMAGFYPILATIHYLKRNYMDEKKWTVDYEMEITFVKHVRHSENIGETLSLLARDRGQRVMSSGSSSWGGPLIDTPDGFPGFLDPIK